MVPAQLRAKVVAKVQLRDIFPRLLGLGTENVDVVGELRLTGPEKKGLGNQAQLEPREHPAQGNVVDEPVHCLQLRLLILVDEGQQGDEDTIRCVDESAMRLCRPRVEFHLAGLH